MQTFEKIQSERRNQPHSSRELGSLAICEVGINDPITHLTQYATKGESAFETIRQDLLTDVAERLPNSFINQVDYVFDGYDFETLENQISMRDMTFTTLQIIQHICEHDKTLNEELRRAEAEANEPNFIANWFEAADEGSYLIFESLPLAGQEYAVNRIFKKEGNNKLKGTFIKLHNPKVGYFNELRHRFGQQADYKTELDFLESPYDISETDQDFIENYVKTYDDIIYHCTGKQSNFGQFDTEKVQNGFDKAKAQRHLAEVYINAIRLLDQSPDRLSSGLYELTNELGFADKYVLGQPIDNNVKRNFLNDIIKGIASVVDRAKDGVLSDIGASGFRDSCSAISYYTEQAKNDGQNYNNTGCPTIGANSMSNLEINSLANAYLPYYVKGQKLELFGKKTYGVCRTYNCPSRGNYFIFPKLTEVGGCSICVECHLLYKDDKLPSRVYKERAKKKAETKKKQKEIAERELKEKTNRRKN